MDRRPCRAMALGLAVVCAVGAAPRASELAPGGLVVAVRSGEVLAAAASDAPLLGSNAAGMLGRIVDGPVAAAGGPWWKVDFEGVVDGWTTTDRLATPYFPPPETAGGWRGLVTANTVPSAERKARVRAVAGLDWDRLRSAASYSASFTSSSAFLVIRNGWIAGEWGAATPRAVASVSKSLTGLVAVKAFDLAVAGTFPLTLNPTEPVHHLLPPSWGAADPSRHAIRVEHLMTMTSGLLADDTPAQADYLNLVLHQPVDVPPDTEWSYASLPVDLLGVALQTTTGRSVQQLFNTHIAQPIGISPLAWSSFDRYTRASSGAVISPRDLARVGYLMMMRGSWAAGAGPSQVISRAGIGLLRRGPPCAQPAVFVATPGSPFLVPATSPEFYGHLWWTNLRGQGLGPTVPSDAVFARGLRENLLVVVPSLDLVVVRLGNAPTTVADFPTQLMSLVMAALTGPPEALAAQAVLTETLIDADTDQPLPLCDPLPEDAVIDLAKLPTRRLNLRANTAPAVVGSVRFGLDGAALFRTETAPPYALAGDVAGDFAAWVPMVGPHVVMATPYSGAGATGSPGVALVSRFTVEDGASSGATGVAR